MRIDQSLRGAVDAAFSLGNARWPAILCDRDQFQRWVVRQEIEADRVANHGPDLYLAGGCALGDPAAIATFDRIYLTRIRPLLGPVTLTEDDLTELRQQLRIKLLVGAKAKIGLYRGQGPLLSWVGACATRTAQNLRRGRFHQALAESCSLEGLVSEEPDAELLLASMQSRTVLSAALRRCLAALPGKEKTLLQMFFVDGLNIDQIGAVFGVHRATIARWIAVIRSKILAEVCRSVSTDLRASRAEVLSLLGLARSEIDIGVGTILVGAANDVARNEVIRRQAAA
jgi:RNA polymerase sigma-70 factor (ECF subfamily)